MLSKPCVQNEPSQQSFLSLYLLSLPPSLAPFSKRIRVTILPLLLAGFLKLFPVLLFLSSSLFQPLHFPASLTPPLAFVITVHLINLVLLSSYSNYSSTLSVRVFFIVVPRFVFITSCGISLLVLMG